MRQRTQISRNDKFTQFHTELSLEESFTGMIFLSKFNNGSVGFFVIDTDKELVHLLMGFTH